MDSRVENFIAVARERLSLEDPKVSNLWARLYSDLKYALPSEECDELERQWDELQRQLRLSKWDEDFLRAIADQESMANDEFGTVSDKYDPNIYTQKTLQEIYKQEAFRKERELAMQNGFQNAYQSVKVATGTGGTAGTVSANPFQGFLK